MRNRSVLVVGAGPVVPPCPAYGARMRLPCRGRRSRSFAGRRPRHDLGIWDAATLAFLLSMDRESEYEMRRLPVVDEVLSTTRRATDAIASHSRAVGFMLGALGPLASRLPYVSGRIAERLLALDLPRPECLDEGRS